MAFYCANSKQVVPGQGTKITQAARHIQKKIANVKNCLYWVEFSSNTLVSQPIRWFSINRFPYLYWFSVYVLSVLPFKLLTLSGYNYFHLFQHKCLFWSFHELSQLKKKAKFQHNWKRDSPRSVEIRHLNGTILKIPDFKNQKYPRNI